MYFAIIIAALALALLTIATPLARLTSTLVIKPATSAFYLGLLLTHPEVWIFLYTSAVKRIKHKSIDLALGSKFFGRVMVAGIRNDHYVIELKCLTGKYTLESCRNAMTERLGSPWGIVLMRVVEDDIDPIYLDKKVLTKAHGVDLSTIREMEFDFLVHLNHSVVSILNDRGVTKADYRPFYNELQYSQPINMAEVYNNKYLLNLDAKLDYWNVLLSLRNAEDSLLVRPIAMRWEKVGSNQEYGLCYYNHHTGEITWKPFSQIQGVSPLTRAMHRAPIKDITSFAE